MRRLLPAVLLALCLASPAARAGDAPAPPPSMEEKALPRVLIQRGERFLNLGKPAAAMACYARIFACCEGTPEAAEAHNDQGVALTRLGRLDEALAEYEKSLAGDGYPLAHFNLGKALLRRFTETGDLASRDRARESFARFREYLRSGREVPAVISYNRQEIEAYLGEAARTLGE